MVFWSFLLLAQYIPFLWQENSSTSIPRRHERTNTIPPVSFFSLLRTLLFLSLYSNLLQKTRATDIDLASLSATQGFSILGAAANDEIGWSVASAGDINGDGFDDILIGAPYARTQAGTSYLIYGGTNLLTIDLASLTSVQGFKISGQSTSRSGYSVSSAGDMNGDGLDDILIGSNRASCNGGAYCGISYVIYGKTTASNVGLGGLAEPQGFTILGGPQEAWAVSSVGDINRDGFDDIIIGSPFASPPIGRSNGGISYVIYGNTTLSTIDLASLTSPNL